MHQANSTTNEYIVRIDRILDTGKKKFITSQNEHGTIASVPVVHGLISIVKLFADDLFFTSRLRQHQIAIDGESI